jgi:hypothetical protein
MLARRAVPPTPQKGVCLSNVFLFIHLRTLCTPWRFATPFPSTTSALFSMQWGGGGYTHRTVVKVILELLAPSSSLPYILPSSVGAKSCVSHSYRNCRGVGVFFPKRNALEYSIIRTFKRFFLRWCPASGEACCGDSSLFQGSRIEQQHSMWAVQKTTAGRRRGSGWLGRRGGLAGGCGRGCRAIRARRRESQANLRHGR